MGLFAGGDLVTVTFPYSGAPGEKLRPALVLATWSIGKLTDCLVCMITSQATGDPRAISLAPADVTPNTALRSQSYIRPVYIYAVGETRIRRKIGSMSKVKVDASLQVIEALLK